jgi:hypothetical protein
MEKKLCAVRIVEQQAGEITRLLDEIGIHAVNSYHDIVPLWMNIG